MNKCARNHCRPARASLLNCTEVHAASSRHESISLVSGSRREAPAVGTNCAPIDASVIPLELRQHAERRNWPEFRDLRLGTRLAKCRSHEMDSTCLGARLGFSGLVFRAPIDCGGGQTAMGSAD